MKQWRHNDKISVRYTLSQAATVSTVTYNKRRLLTLSKPDSGALATLLTTGIQDYLRAALLSYDLLEDLGTTHVLP